MSIISQRAGRVNVRVGGNTQETATLVESLADGKALEKDKTDTTNPVRNALNHLCQRLTSHGCLLRLTDGYTGPTVHSRDYLHVCQCICSREHEVVLGYVADC